MRTIVATLSVVNVIAGAGLALLYVTDANPPIVAVLSGVLVVQGVYTIALVAGVLDRTRVTAVRVQLIGSTLALVVGVVAVVTGSIATLATSNPDPEGGPLAVAVLMAMHGLVSLLAFGNRTVPSSSEHLGA